MNPPENDIATGVALRGTEETKRKRLNLLVKTAESLESKKFEIDQVEAQKPIVIAEIEKSVSDLSAEIAPEKLFCLNPDDAALDPETSYSVKKLNSLRTKLELIPGVLARLKNDLAKAQIDARRLAEEICDDLRDDAREKLDELTIELHTQFFPVCGKDEARTRTAVKAVVDASELKRWLNGFDSLVGDASPSNLRNFHKFAVGYEAGKPAREIA